VEEAAEQAFVITFKDSAHLNYEGDGNAVEVSFTPAALAPEENSDVSRAYVLTWFGPALDVGDADEQCPVKNQKPTDDDYYARLPRDIAEKERRLNNENRGGVRPEQLGFRGPNRLNIAALPGIVEDPGHAEPQTRLARGLNLDGTEDGSATANTCQHEKFVSQIDGETMVDNQLYRVDGCVASLRGREALVPAFSNNNMRDGAYSILVQISDVEDWENDDQVEVGFFFSLDPMAKSGSGAEILSNYTFRITEEPKYAHYHRRLAGRIVDGVVHTEPVDMFQWNMGVYATPFELELADAQMRFDLLPNGGLKGVLGGYVDWRERVSGYGNGTGEIYSNVYLPGYFNAFKRNADGLKDPVTGQCNGISAAYDVEGERAFIRPAPKPEVEITQVTQATP
jgi:hypothetical protein